MSPSPATVALVALLLRASASAAMPEPTPAPAATPPSPCAGPVYGALNFWLGEWTVTDPNGGAPQGRNTIETVLGGCAILEHWRDAGGREGKSLFYVDRTTRRWKQVWVTDEGLTKEKEQLADHEGPGVRFQGRVRRRDGVLVLDRTTLTPMSYGRVRQRIEQSTDDGKTWRGWEGIYTRTGNPPASSR
jgi:hypothetical protein